MKRVIRDVIKIVTTIRWLPEDRESQIASSAGAPVVELKSPNRESYDVAPGTMADNPDPMPDYICYTYILIYRVLDR